MQNMNATESVRHLQEQIGKEMQEMAKLQEQIRACETDDAKMKTEIPRLQKETYADEQKLRENESTLLPKLKVKLAELQREKMKLQSDFSLAQKSLQDGLRNQSIKLH
jgi:hypothetical protein